MANLGTATIPVIPSASINIPRPGAIQSGAVSASDANELTPEAVSPYLNEVNVGDTVYNTSVSPNTVGIVTALNYTGANITSVETTIAWTNGNRYFIYNSYLAGSMPPESAVEAEILKNQGNGKIGIYSASAGAITGVDSNGNTFSYTAVAGATLPFFVSRINTIAAGMTALVGFVNND